MKLEAIQKLFDSLNTASIRYLVVGGFAVIAHGYTRLTMDIDIVLSLEMPNLLRALDIFAKLGYRPKVPVQLHEFADENKRHSWIKEKNMVVFSIFTPDSSFPPIDIFPVEPFDFETEYARGITFNISEQCSVPVICIDTLIRMKQDAGRPKDSVDLEHLTILKSEMCNETE